MQDIFFRGLAAPLRLRGSDAVLNILPKIVGGWPIRCERENAALAPFFSITAEAGETRLRCENHLEDKPPRRLDPVNAVCDLVSALAQALPAETQSLICLHAAAVTMAGRLVVFPSTRRAGKSTLSAALAHAGCQVFSDDVLPVFFAAPHTAYGLAMGIAPRLRLPLPPSIDHRFRDWVEAVTGPRNRQYQYLTLPDQPPHGTVLPVGAFVILDRQETPAAARLEPVTPDVAMDVLLRQNFTRDRHSADILQAMAATLADRPAFRLTYSDLADAVTHLQAAFANWPDAGPEMPPGTARTFRKAAFYFTPAAIDPASQAIRQRPGFGAAMIGAVLYLADAEGRAIHRMDPLASAIWALLEDPITAQEIAELLVEAFPDAGADRIATDLRRLLTRFLAAGLIEASSTT